MTAFNVVRFRVKPGREKDFIDAHKNMGSKPPKGARRFALIRTGNSTFCIVGEWDSMDSIVAARPMMLGMLDGLREMLEDLGGDLGVTDPVSGEAVVEMSAAGAKRKPASKARATSARQGKPAAKKKAAKPATRKAARKPARKKAAKRSRK